MLEELYPLVGLFVEHMPKQSHRLMVLALDQRFLALPSIIALNKKLVRETSLGFEKDLDEENGEGYNERCTSCQCR